MVTISKKGHHINITGTGSMWYWIVVFCGGVFSRSAPSGIANTLSHRTFSVAITNARKSPLVAHDQYYLAMLASFGGGVGL